MSLKRSFGWFEFGKSSVFVRGGSVELGEFVLSSLEGWFEWVKFVFGWGEFRLSGLKLGLNGWVFSVYFEIMWVSFVDFI